MDWKRFSRSDEDILSTTLPRKTEKQKQSKPSRHPVENENIDVIVIGNGPSAICLSYILSGHWPFYNSNQDATLVLDEGLQARLSTVTQESSLIEQDLSFLSDGLEGRSSNPISVLFDALANPGADIGARLPSSLKWEFSSKRSVPHIVLGRKDVGGVWQNQNEQESEGRTKTLSLGSWMELPGMSLEKWLNERHSKRQMNSEGAFRASMADIASYYHEYVKRQNLSQYFRKYSTVTSLNRIPVGTRSLDCENGEMEEEFEDKRSCQNYLWEVCGYRTNYDEFFEEQITEFRYTASNVVLATGIFDLPKRLGVPGENLPYVVHSFHELEKRLEGDASNFQDPVVVIGDGLTAADAILMLRQRKIPTVHIHRQNKESRMYQQLVPKIYPEYHEVYRLMNSNVTPEWYTGYTSVDVLRFTPQHDVTIRCQKTEVKTTVKASFVAVLVGSRPDLSFICPSVLNDLGIKRNIPIDGKQNLVNVDKFSYESVHHEGLYAMGPLVGDQMVRFIRGGALGIASHIWNRKQKNTKGPSCDNSDNLINSSKLH